ncbi:unnamed protein product [Tilletia controversa]|nr:unnamed protein product [Tilletia controversa]
MSRRSGPPSRPYRMPLRVMRERHSIAGTGRMLGRKPGWTRSIASASLARANPILDDMPLMPPDTFHRTTPAI